MLLPDVRRLAEETMRICKPELQDVMRSGGVPLESLLRLLRLLQRLAASGAGRLLEPGDTVGWGWEGGGGQVAAARTGEGQCQWIAWLQGQLVAISRCLLAELRIDRRLCRVLVWHAGGQPACAAHPDRGGGCRRSAHHHDGAGHAAARCEPY